jgi:phage-related tail fiber protein
MYILFEFDHSAFNHEIEIPVDINITFEETYLEYGLRDDFSGTKLNNRLNQKEGKYNTGSIIWDNAWLRPDWTPETTGTYSMNDGYISVTNKDASIRAPTVNVDVTDGFRMKIDMRHNRTRGRMNFELGRIEDGTWTTIFKITNNAGNNKLAGLVYINGNTNTIYSSTRTTNDDTWYTYEISYDGNTWRFKRNGSTLGTASFSTPNKEPTHMQLRNSAHDGEGGLWRNLYIDSEY